MTNSKNKLAGVLLAALMTVSAVTAPAFMTTNDLTEPVSIVQTIEANAAYSTGKYQVNTSSGINVRKSNNTSSAKVGAATNGTQFNVTKISGNWGYTNSIKCTNGTKSGWVCLDYCKKVSGDNYVTPLTDGGIYWISPACATGSLLDISGGASNKKDGANVQIYTAHKGTNQQFKARLQSDGSYIFEAVSSGKVLDVNIKTDNVTQWTNKSGNNQKWYLKNAGNGYYYVVYYWNTGYCLDVSGAGSKDGTNVQIYPSNGTNAQKFKFTKYIPPIPNDYNPTDAINYAKKYWQNYNPSYKNLNPVGGDCANFVSQCLKAGGLKTDKTWSPYTYAWVNCEGQLNYLGKYYQVTDWAKASDLRVGDVVYYYNGSKIAHTAICTKVSNGQAYVTAHNKNHIDYEWTLGGSKWWGGSTRRVVVHMSKKK